jgi:hypothetical protein
MYEHILEMDSINTLFFVKINVIKRTKRYFCHLSIRILGSISIKLKYHRENAKSESNTKSSVPSVINFPYSACQKNISYLTIRGSHILLFRYINFPFIYNA